MTAFDFITPLPTNPDDTSLDDWYAHYNNLAVGKLNKLYISRPFAGDGITLGYNPASGGHTLSLSGTVAKNMTFLGDVVFSGNVSLANAELSGLAFGVSGNYIGSGVTLGKVVRVLHTGGLALARADNSENAEVLGIAISVDTTETVVAIAGKISGSVLANNLVSGGFSAGCVYFLDPSNSGKVTKTEPNTINQVSKPILLGLSNTEAALLPYRGQLINGISGSSGEISFNSTLYVTAQSIGDAEPNFDLRPGYFIASSASCPSGEQCYNGLGEDVYYRATRITPRENILGLVQSYVGSYSPTSGDNITLKVYPTSSVINNISSLNNWSSVSSGVVYLNDLGLPLNAVSTMIVGIISNDNLVLNIQPLESSSLSSFLPEYGSELQSPATSNIIANGQHHLWQRSKGVTSPYGITTGSAQTKKEYLADRFVMWAGPNVTGFTAQRESFSNTQIDVGGYPKYYVTMKKTTSSPSKTYYYSVIDDTRTLAEKQLTFSVYARTPGSTGTFRVHGIQNISLSPSGNTYINGTTYATITTGNSNWNRYSVTFTGHTAYSGITNSYSLLGVELVDDGKTYDFAQFILNEGNTAIKPVFVNSFDEYQRVAPYYQRSYLPDETSGSDIANVNRGINQVILPLNERIFHSFKVPMKNSPTVSVYSLNGTINQVSMYFRSADEYVDISNSKISNSPTYGGCVRSTIIGQTYIGPITKSNNDFYFGLEQNYCTFDEIAFHYVADGDTTIN